MVGAILKFDNWSKNIIKLLLNDIDVASWSFYIQYWESYGESDLEHDFNKMKTIKSNLFKQEILYKNQEIYPEFLELFAKRKTHSTKHIRTYKDFVDSYYFLSIVIIDHRIVEICCKDENTLKKIISNFKGSDLNNKQVSVLTRIKEESVLLSYRSITETGIGDFN